MLCLYGLMDEKVRPLEQSAKLISSFLISQPKHMLWVLKRTIILTQKQLRNKKKQFSITHAYLEAWVISKLSIVPDYSFCISVPYSFFFIFANIANPVDTAFCSISPQSTANVIVPNFRSLVENR